MIRIRTGLLLFSIFLTPALSAQDVQQVSGQGMASYRAGDFEEAIQSFRQVVSLAPDQVVALELLNDSQDALLELMVAGGEFETFALEIPIPKEPVFVQIPLVETSG